MALMALAQARAGNTGTCEAMTAASVTTKCGITCWFLP
ncbi:hypothetical protein AB67_4244 [Escherichia coli 5-366-08_S1_C3]|nr:hypothetical protein AB67_4244 [Escherichia coli 5-366-08_S1_C3]